MSARSWPADRARTWEMTTATAFVEDGYLNTEARSLANDATSEPGAWSVEAGFRALLAAELSWTDDEIDRVVAGLYGDTPAVAPRDPAALIAAIRAFTVDARDGAAHGEAERQMLRLQELLSPGRWAAVSRAHVGEVNDAAAKLCEALSDDTRALRLAAEAYFGGDFAAPDPAETMKGGNA